MSHVSVTIHGRQYRMACEDGQEDYLHSLAQDLDQRIADLRARFTDITESRLLVMAALMVSDELSEKTRQLEESQNARFDAGAIGPTAADRVQATQNAIAAALNAASERIESVTKDLNQSLGENVPIG